MIGQYLYFCTIMLLFLKTAKSVRKFCQQLEPECTKLIKTGIFQELGSLGSYPLHFVIIEGLVTSLCQASWQSQIIQILLLVISQGLLPHLHISANKQLSSNIS